MTSSGFELADVRPILDPIVGCIACDSIDDANKAEDESPRNRVETRGKEARLPPSFTP